MAVEHGKLLKLRWLWLLVLVVVPLLVMPELFRELKAAGVMQHNSIDSCVTFTYTGGREVKYYAYIPDMVEEMRDVFLPSYADMDHIGVDTIAYRVEFVKD